MKIISQLICSLVFFPFLLLSCSSSDNASPFAFDDEYVNQQILLTAPNYSNNFRTSDPIHLELKYNAEAEIVFQSDFNLMIFERIDESWVQIKEKATEPYPSDDIVFAPTELMPIVQVIVIFPDLQNLLNQHQLRIYVSGDMKSDGATQKVAAYVDIRLRP